MTKLSPFKYFKTSREIIRLAVMLYVRFPLSCWMSLRTDPAGVEIVTEI